MKWSQRGVQAGTAARGRLVRNLDLPGYTPAQKKLLATLLLNQTNAVDLSLPPAERCAAARGGASVSSASAGDPVCQSASR